MNFVTINGKDFVQIQTLAEALGVCTATVYNWQRAGHLAFSRPLGKALTFVSRESAERLMRLKITAEMGAFLKGMEA
jgi:predicted site-specific integrase-resolvase